MPNCAVTGCNNHNKMKKIAEIKFYTFPKNEDLARQWVHACRRADKINMKSATICSKHFESKCFFTSIKYRLLNQTPPRTFRNLQCDAIPTLFLPKRSTDAIASSSSDNHPGPSNRCQRMQVKNDLRNRQFTIEEILSSGTKFDTADNMRLEQVESEVLKAEVVEDPNSLTNMSEFMKEMELMKIKILSLEKEVDSLKLKNEVLENDKIASDSKLSSFLVSLNNYFTPGQVKRILNPNKNYLNWTSEDIASAISLRSVSPKAYRYLKKNGYPLPALSTLRRWAINLKQGHT